jgi:hypothetical protein
VTREKDGYRLAKNQGRCRWCQKPFTKRPVYGPLFCSISGDDSCRAKYERNTGKSGLAGRPPLDKPGQMIGKRLAFDELYDPIRDVLREEVRATITQHVKDEVLGMTDMMADLLPLVLAGIASDVQSEDPFIRSKAQALILKYVMPLKHEEAAADDSKVLNVIHHVSIPDTPLGHQVEGELVALPIGVEAFEADYPECHMCHERKHPETGYWIKDSAQETEFWRCTACNARKSLDKSNPELYAPQDDA